jgi:predicted transglutaminase-like cysteine proteinase
MNLATAKKKKTGIKTTPINITSEDFIKQSQQELLFFTLIIYISLITIFLLTPFAWTTPIYPFSWLFNRMIFWILSGIGFGIIYRIIQWVKRHHEFWFPSMPLFIHVLNRRTGIKQFDRVCAAWFLGVSIIFAFVGWRLLSLTLPAAMVFFILANKKVELWAVAPRLPVRNVPKIEPHLDDPNYELHQFNWSFYTGAQEQRIGRLDITINMASYRDHSANNPTRKVPPNIAAPQGLVYELAVNGTTEEIWQAMEGFHKMSEQNRYSTYEEILNVLSFVQNIKYVTDEESVNIKDYWRYPIESFRDEQGDCECKSILAASILRSLMHKTILLVSAEEQHAALAVAGAKGFPGEFFLYEDEHYFFCETTATGLIVGQLPPNVDLDKYKPVPLELPKREEDKPVNADPE